MNGLFTIYFFNLKKYSTILSKLLLANSVAGVLFIPLLFYWPELGVLPAMLFNTIWLLLSSVACITAYYRGWRSATYFGFGLACLWCAISMVVMIQLGVIETFTDHQANILLFGCMINLLFMSYALVDRFTSIARKSALTSEQLEQSVQNRTAELQTLNQSLEQLAVQFQAANEAKNTFLVNMSHEIRTPLTAIIGYADGMLQGDINDTDKEQAIKVISQNGVHLLDIISDLLDISKIESNKLEIEMQPVDPLALCQGIESLVREQVQSKGLTMTINYQLPLPTQIISDPNRLRQVLLNIINNAIKFTHTGTIDISVHTDIDENKFFVSISDTGIGMSQSQIDGMFTAFRQEDLSISRQYGGAGLGLSIAKSLTTKLGGDIEVTSQQSQGSTFKVIIDLKVPKSTKWLHQQSALYQFLSGIEQQADEVESINLPALSGHVLLAEDHMDNQLLFIRLLERMGLKVTAVDNGYKAVQATLEREFELILLDIQMPEMDGLKAFELIQTTCANVPVVALTANAMPADVELYKKLGFNDHIAKPIDRQKFVDTITQYLNIERSGSFSMELDEMGEITAQFIARLVLRVGDIKVAQANKDWQEIGKHAHAIKGSAGMFGFDDLGLQGAALELAVKNGEQAICQDALDKLLQMCDAVTA
jgi:signal transduction histidine kinase/DNA-binding response OmpR family regulator